jgi:acetyl esterase
MRKRLGSAAIQGFFETAAAAGRLLPSSQRLLRSLSVERELAYGPLDPWNRLDVWRPPEGAPVPGGGDASSRPALLYLHGGGFRILSKGTHWAMAALLARAGYVVFNANYRLAPQGPYPAGLEDASLAYRWVARSAAAHGADASRLVVAGESAGANLTLSLALCATSEREEPWARDLFATGVVPRAIAPVCGIFQVSDSARFARRKAHLSKLVADRLEEIESAYLQGPGPKPLADPLLVLEGDWQPQRPFPPVYTAVGTRDPLLDDTRRLAAALARRGIAHQADYFPGELHAFHAFYFKPAARKLWDAQLTFLSRSLAR